jgi:hypothetical protein
MRNAVGDGTWVELECQSPLVFPWLGSCSAGLELFFGTCRRTRAKLADRESMSLGAFEPLS